MLGAYDGEEYDHDEEQDEQDATEFVSAGSLLGGSLSTVGRHPFVLVFVELL